MEGNIVCEQVVLEEEANSFLTVVGVGDSGCDIVETIRNAGFLDFDYALVSNSWHTLEGKSVVNKLLLSDNESENNELLQNLFGFSSKFLVVVAGLDETPMVPVVAGLCRQFHDKCGINATSLVLAVLPSQSENGGMELEKSMGLIAKQATNVITIDTGHFCNQPVLSALSGQSLACKYVYNYIYVVTQMFMNHKYGCNDYQDVVALLHSGNRPMVVTGTGSGGNRVENIFKALKDKIIDLKCQEADIHLLLHFCFSPSHPLSEKEFQFMTALLQKSFFSREHIDMLFNCSDDAGISDDTILYNAIVM